MVFETLIATALYTGAITSLHYDGPPNKTAGLSQQTLQPRTMISTSPTSVAKASGPRTMASSKIGQSKSI